MKSPWIRAGLVSAVLLGFHNSETRVFANWGRSGTLVSETVLGVPSAYVVPTSYVAETSYAVPTTYLYPTAAYYTPTSYVAESSYLLPTAYTTAYDIPSYSLTPTAYATPAYTTSYYYRRPGLLGRLFGRRSLVATSSSYYVPTTYVPTSYVATAAYYPTANIYPTIYDFPVATTATTLAAAPTSACCGTAAADSVVAAPAPSRSSVPVQPSAPSAAPERAPSSVIDSTPNEPELQTSPPPPDTKTNAAQPNAANDDIPLPKQPTLDKEPADQPAEKSTAKPAPGNVNDKDLTIPAPIAPGDVPPAAPAGNNPKGAMLDLPGETRRIVNRPRFTPVSKMSRSMLEGTVIDSETNRTEEGVRVIITNRAGIFGERVVTTNNLGQYAVRLPDGDWTVKVTMPSGRVYPVSELTISNGTIVDDRGRDIPTLTIKR